MMNLNGRCSGGSATGWTLKSSVLQRLYLTLVFTALFVPSSALRHVPGSPCEDVCSQATAGDIEKDVVCTDKAYLRTPGSHVEECTTCLLNSTAADSGNNDTDVLWALWNLRYTLSECMFAYPKEIVSISSPCQVTCQKVRNATVFGISEGAGNGSVETSPQLDFCNHGFSDLDINNCAFCYSMIDQQLFLANFLQALHIACRQPPTAGQSFYPNGQAIFNESAIAGPAPPDPNAGKSSGLTGWKLGLVIALPIVGGALLFAGTCFCCFRFTRHRRQKMAASGRMTRVHDNMAASSPISAKPSPYVWDRPVSEHEMYPDMSQYEQDVRAGKQRSPGYPSGRWSHPQTQEGTPLSASFPQSVRDDVGPGEGQQQDPYLHEQYFAVPDGGGAVAAGDPNFRLSYHGNNRPGERGSWQ